MKEKNLMLSGKLYKAADDELKQDFLYAKKITRQINLTAEDESEKRQLLFKQLFKSTGNNFYIEPPFHCDYGKNISIGENFYALMCVTSILAIMCFWLREFVFTQRLILLMQKFAIPVWSMEKKLILVIMYGFAETL